MYEKLDKGTYEELAAAGQPGTKEYAGLKSRFEGKFGDPPESGKAKVEDEYMKNKTKV